MREELKALIKLAKIDETAREFDQELASIPDHLEELTADLRRLEALLESERQQLAEAERMAREAEEQTSQRNDMLVRARAKAAKAKSAREAEAAERELDAVRRTSRDRDDERKRLTETVDGLRETLATHEKELSEFRAEVDAEREKGEARLSEVKAKLDEINTGRGEVAKNVPRQALSRYERIRRSRPQPVVPVVDGTCTGCRLQITPMQFQQLHYVNSIEQCPHCMRFLYLEETLLVGQEVEELA